MSQKGGRNEGIRVLEEFICEAVPAPAGAIAEKSPRRRLFTVERTWKVEKYGTVLAPGVIPEATEVFRPGRVIALRRPDGTELRTSISGLDYFHLGANGESLVLVNLPESDVPVGTEVWST